MKNTRRLLFAMAVLLLPAFMLCVTPTSTLAKTRGITVKALTHSGAVRDIPLYSGYHALVVGCGAYRGGWPRLPNPVKDSREVAAALKKLGCEVNLLTDPDWATLRRALNTLITGPGRVQDKAILFWFSGHGHTLKEAGGRDLGYIVPVDAPNPDRDEIGFMEHAISMRQIETLARRITARHVMMIFDSCFSGAIFQTVRSKPSPYIKEKVQKPVRQFITAGNKDEQVPDVSVFKTVFIQSILEGYADRNTDGYVTGMELGDYLLEQVVNYSRGAQHPQFGKINDPKLDKGDFVIHLNRSKKAVNTAPPPPAKKDQKAVTPKPKPKPAKVGDKRKTIAMYTPSKQPLSHPLKQLRSLPMKRLNERDLNAFLRQYDFYDRRRNESGNFSNELIDNQNGTITDKTTGLIWEKAGSPKKLGYRSAKKYIMKLNQEKFAGRADWRLPTLEELASLIEKQPSRPGGLFIDPLFDDPGGTPIDRCWSADGHKPIYACKNGGWIVNFKKGTIVDVNWEQSGDQNCSSFSPFNFVRAVCSK